MFPGPETSYCINRPSGVRRCTSFSRYYSSKDLEIGRERDGGGRGFHLYLWKNERGRSLLRFSRSRHVIRINAFQDGTD